MDRLIAASELAPYRRPHIQGGEDNTNRQPAPHAQDPNFPKRPVPRQTKERDEPTTPDCPKYPSRTAIVPSNFTCYDICQGCPNHVWGNCLNHFIHHRYSASDIWECVPDDFKRWVKSHKSMKLSTKTWQNGYRSAHTVTAEGEENTKHNEEDGGDEKIEEVEEDENKKTDRNENTPMTKRLKRQTRRLADSDLYDGVMKDPHTRSDGRPSHLMKPGKRCSCASDPTVGGDEAEEAIIASPVEHTLVHNHSTRNHETRARDDDAEDMIRPGHTILPATQTVDFGQVASSASQIAHGLIAPRPSMQQPHAFPHTATDNHAMSLPVLVDHQLLNPERTVIAHNSATVPVSKTIHGAIVKTMRVLPPRGIDNQEGPDALLQGKVSVLEVAVMGQVVGHEDNVEAVRDVDVRQAFGILRNEQDADPVVTSTETSAHGDATNSICIDDDVDTGQVNKTSTEKTDDRSSQLHGLAAPESMSGEIIGWTQMPLAVYRGRNGRVVEEIICVEEVGHVNNIEAIQDETVRRLYKGFLIGGPNNTGLPPAYTEADGIIVKMSISLKVVDPAHDPTEFQDVLVRRAGAAEEKVASEASTQ